MIAVTRVLTQKLFAAMLKVSMFGPSIEARVESNENAKLHPGLRRGFETWYGPWSKGKSAP